jgi:hypothetical protein
MKSVSGPDDRTPRSLRRPWAAVGWLGLVFLASRSLWVGHMFSRGYPPPGKREMRCPICNSWIEFETWPPDPPPCYGPANEPHDETFMKKAKNGKIL